MQWAAIIFALFVAGFAFGMDTQHNWRDWVGPALMTVGIVISLLHFPLWVSGVLTAVLVLKLLTR